MPSFVRTCLACRRHPAGGKRGDRTRTQQPLADPPHDLALPAGRWQHAKHIRWFCKRKGAEGAPPFADCLQIFSGLIYFTFLTLSHRPVFADLSTASVT